MDGQEGGIVDVCRMKNTCHTHQIINPMLHVHTHIITRVFRNHQRQEYVLLLKDDVGGGD